MCGNTYCTVSLFHSNCSGVSIISPCPSFPKVRVILSRGFAVFCLPSFALPPFAFLYLRHHLVGCELRAPRTVPILVLTAPDVGGRKQIPPGLGPTRCGNRYSPVVGAISQIRHLLACPFVIWPHGSTESRGIQDMTR